MMINSNGRKIAAIIWSVVAVLLITGCSEKPLASLMDDQPSLKYTESFWNQEQKANSVLWQQATGLCNGEAYRGKPNCGSIHDLQIFANAKPFPKYGSGQGFGTVELSK